MEIAPQDITIEALQSGALDQAFPLWANLNETVEHNPAHEHQPVGDHTMNVLEGLVQNFTLDFVQDETLREKLREYLEDTPDIVSRQTLIFLATVFHDIGKAYTLLEVAPGVWACPGHELISAGIAREYLEKIALTNREKSWILQFIILHGYVHGLLNVGLEREDHDFFASFHAAAGDMTAGLLLFVHADNLGSDLQKLNPEDFVRRTELIQKMLGWWYETV